MKKMIYLIVLIVILILVVGFKDNTVTQFPLIGKIIIIDPGHGGLDPGSIYKNEYEKNYNLEFSKVLKNRLEKNGATVFMTREGDYDISAPLTKRRKKSDFENRIKLINESDANLFISLHMNYLQKENYKGPQCFYYDKKSNYRAAKIIQEKLNKGLHQNRDIVQLKNDKYLYKRLNIPGLLIEFGFLSNKIDRNRLKTITYKNELSDLIIDGIVAYFT